MCCVLQGAERVFPSPATKQRHGLVVSSKDQQQQRSRDSSPLGAHDLPLESLWAAGLDEGMGFPQRCSYANQRSVHSNNPGPSTPDDLWSERNASYR